MSASRHRGQLRNAVVSVFVLSAAQGVAFAQKGPPAIVRPPDDRRDYYQVSTELQTIGNSVCALILRTALQDNGDGTFTLNVQTLADQMAENDMMVCESETFRNQPANAECTASLVTSNVVVSAGHCLNEADLATWYFVFDYVMRDANTLPTTFNADQVYTGVEILGHENVENTARDWTLVRLDRAVSGRTPLRVADSEVTLTQSILTIGFGAGLPMKFSANATVQALQEAGFEADLDIIGGNSGGPVLDAQSFRLVGVINADLAVEDFFQDGDCFRATVCPGDDICEEGFTSICGAKYEPFDARLTEVIGAASMTCGEGMCGAGTAMMAPALLLCFALRRRVGRRRARR